MNLRSLAGQATAHISARVASSVFSFALFALISRKLLDETAQHAFFFLFALGFGLATLRMLGQLAARIDGQARSALRLRHAYAGLIAIIHGLPVGIFFLLFVLWYHTHDLVVITCAFILTPLAALDFDLLRSVVNRGPAFTTTYAIGTLLALIGIFLWPKPGLRGVCLLFILQWVPTAILNCKSVCRTFSRKIVVQHSGRKTISLLLLACFDGVILNAPFLGFFKPEPSTGIELSIAMRIFTASLPVLPLLMHWANSSFLGHLTKQFDMSINFGFIVFLVSTGICTGIAFAFSFILISGKIISIKVFFLYLILLVSYSVYASQMRLTAPLLSTRVRIVILTSIITSFLFIFFIFSKQFSIHVIWIVMFQSLALSSSSIAFSLASRIK